MQQSINGWEDKQDFIDFLVTTLIPDLKDSGMEATAEDFESAVFFMRGYDEN